MIQTSLYFLFVTLLLLGGCGNSGDDTDTQEGEHTHGETTHTHADEATSIAVTLWADDLELFMEHPVLRVGQPARFAVHLTRLRDFQPVESGPVLFRFSNEDVEPKIVTVGNPEVAGIFGPTVTFDEAGDYQLHLEVMSEELETSLSYGPIQVLGPEEEAAPSQEPSTGQTITYLKEQQWKLPFASAEVARRELQETLRVPAEVKSKTGMETMVATAAGGRYVPPEAGMPALGARVRSGDLLGYLELLPADRSSLLDSQMSAGISMSRLSQDLAQAEARVSAEQARLEVAEKEFRRVSELVKAEALPEKRLEQAESEVKIRRSSLQAARASLETYREALARYDSTQNFLESIQERLPLHASVSGQIVETYAVPGQYVDARERLFRVIDLSTVWVEGQVFERDLSRLDKLEGGTLELSGLQKIELDASSLVLVGSALHPSVRTLPVVFEVENPSGRLKIGALGQLELKTGDSIEAIAVPASAVLLEENRSVVYAQLGGETFERRLVTTGIEDGDWVEIRQGLDGGERIVTKGAYDVALAARSTEVPEHGHVH